MYQLTPLKVFIESRVHEKPAWIARANRIIKACGRPPEAVVTVTEENLPEVVGELQNLWPPETVPEGLERTYMRPLVFTVQELTDERPDISAQIERCGGEASEHVLRHLLGQFDTVRAYHKRADDQEKNYVCWPTFDFGSMAGCPHGCHYCGEGKSGKFITLAVNLEEFVGEVVPRTVEEHPFQNCFRMIGWGAEHISFEPEYGMFDLFTKKLAELDRYGYFHAAGANVDWIRDLPRRDRLIGVFSVTCDLVARNIEPGAGGAVERFEAGRKLNELGVPVRYKFKPMIPVKNWREENAHAIEEMFRRSRPESVGVCVIMWMDVDTLTEKIDPDLLDPDYLAAAREAAGDLKDVVTGPYPHAVRKEIYRFFIKQVRRWDKKVPIYISTESREMWDDLKDELGQDPRAFFCGCSPVALPGRKLALSEDFRHSTYCPTAS